MECALLAPGFLARTLKALHGWRVGKPSIGFSDGSIIRQYFPIIKKSEQFLTDLSCQIGGCELERSYAQQRKREQARAFTASTDKEVCFKDLFSYFSRTFNLIKVQNNSRKDRYDLTPPSRLGRVQGTVSFLFKLSRRRRPAEHVPPPGKHLKLAIRAAFEYLTLHLRHIIPDSTGN